MLLSILAIVLAALTLISLNVDEGNPTAPAVLFAGGFLFSAFWAVCFAARWGYEMHTNTFLAVGGGVTIFVLVSLLVRRLVFKGQVWKETLKSSENIVCSNVVVGLFVLLQVVVTLWFLLRVSQMFPASSIQASIAAYKGAGTFTTQSTYLGFPLNPLRVFCLNAAYVTGFVFCASLATRTKGTLMILSSMSVLVNCLMQLESGARTGFATYLVYLVTVYLLELREFGRGKLAISRRMVILGITACVLFILCFRLLAVGRHTSFSISDALSNVSVYCGSEIPNLDHWMQAPSESANDVWGSMTFIRSINYLGPKLHIDAWTYPLDLPNLNMHWSWMGNVYTTFYAFLYDFGSMGLVACTGVMAIVAETIFCLTGRATKLRDLWIILYGICAPQLFLSFFSNKFYENFFSIPFVRTLLVIVIMRALLMFDWKRPVSALRVNRPNRKSHLFGKAEQA